MSTQTATQTASRGQGNRGGNRGKGRGGRGRGANRGNRQTTNGGEQRAVEAVQTLTEAAVVSLNESEVANDDDAASVQTGPEMCWICAEPVK